MAGAAPLLIGAAWPHDRARRRGVNRVSGRRCGPGSVRAFPFQAREAYLCVRDSSLDRRAVARRAPLACARQAGNGPRGGIIVAREEVDDGWKSC